MKTLPSNYYEKIFGILSYSILLTIKKVNPLPFKQENRKQSPSFGTSGILYSSILTLSFLRFRRDCIRCTP